MTEKKKHYSVLMSVYHKEKPDFLRESMQSMYDQTVPTDDYVLVCDGPLTDELDSVIAEMQKKFGKRLNVLRQAKNHGLGYSLNLGVKECKNDLIASMDSDDVAVKTRCEKELEVFESHPELSVVGGYVGEFEKSVKDVKSVRKVPEKNAEIIEFAKGRNPFNHPTVMFKKKDVLKVGNYQNIRFCQDYFLWVELLASGHKGYNIQEILVYMREDDNTFKRRSGKGYYVIQKKLLQQMREKGFISRGQYIKSLSIRFCSSFAPNWLRRTLFNSLMRSNNYGDINR